MSHIRVFKCLFALSLFFLGGQEAVFAQEAAGKTEAQTSQPAKQEADTPLPEIAMGDDKAPVTLIEYSSLSCPHCAAFHKSVLPKLKADFVETGKVRYIVREFPLDNGAALGGAIVARCLDTSQYIPFIDMLFDRQKEWAFQEDALTPLKEFAKQAGLPEKKFDACIDDETLAKRIQKVRDEGEKLGVKATPTLFIDGKAADNLSYEAIAGAINGLIAKH